MLIADQLKHVQAGTESQMLMLFNGLRSAGWQVELTVLRGADTIRRIWPAPVRELRVDRMSSPASWWRALRFALQTRRSGFRVVHIFLNDAAILLPPFLAMAGITVIVARRDMGFWYTAAKLRALRITRRFVSKVVANSHAVAASVVAHEGYSPSSIAVIYNGVEAGDFHKSPNGVNSESLRIGLVANIRPVKRIDDAVAGLGRVASKYPDVVLEIVGDGDATALEEQAARLELSDRVRFVGRQTDIQSRLSRYSICLLTSESEGLSNAIIEYLMAERAVICTDAGGNSEIVEHGRTGLLFPVGDVDMLATHLDTLLGDAALRKQIGEAGRKRAEELFASAKMIEKHELLYRDILQAGSST